MGQSQFEDEVLGGLQPSTQSSEPAPALSEPEASAPAAMPSQVVARLQVCQPAPHLCRSRAG